MPYAGEQVIAALKAARNEKKLTQRDLSKQAGVPQSHISKIEAGEVNLQLSSLIELARALDLELMLIPRRLVPAAQTIMRSGESEFSRPAANVRLFLRALHSIRNILPRLQTVGDKKDLELLKRTAAELENFLAGAREAEKIRLILSPFRKGATPTKQDINRAAKALQDLRNQLAHNLQKPAEPVRPAYALDEDDDA